MRNLKIIFTLSLSLFFFACGAKLEKVQEKTLNEQDYKALNLNRTWWKNYDDTKLNDFINEVLANNTDINIARISLLSTMARADLIDYDLYPSLGTSSILSLSKSKDLNSGKNTNLSYSNGLNLSYELDIYGKIYDSTKAAEFNARASAYDLENLKLSVINSAINGIFELAYYNDVENLLTNYITNLEQMQKLYKLKFELGKIAELDLLNTEQSLLRAKQNLITNTQNRNALLKSLKDLLGEDEKFDSEYFKTLSLANFKTLTPNYNLPLELFSYRPDVKSKINNLKAAFKDYSSMQKSILPSISLGASLRGENEAFKESFKFEILGGALQLSLPFLDYGRVKQNIKISQFSYESLVFEYKQILQNALSEFWLNSKDYESYKNLLENLATIKSKQEQITASYLALYNLGKSELKDYLDANNALNSTAQDELRARYNLLRNINAYYQITTLEYKDLGFEELER